MKNTNRQVKVAEPIKKHEADRININNNAIDRDNRTSNNIVVPIWEKAALTIEEAAAYSNIGICKLNELAKKPDCPFVLYIGKKKLVKRERFEKYISDSVEI